MKQELKRVFVFEGTGEDCWAREWKLGMVNNEKGCENMAETIIKEPVRIVWRDRDGVIIRNEIVTIKEAQTIANQLFGIIVDKALGIIVHKANCGHYDALTNTLTIYTRGGSWCQEHAAECLGSGCDVARAMELGRRRIMERNSSGGG